MLCRELVEYLANMPDWYLSELAKFGRVIHIDEDFEYRWFGPNWRYLYPNR